MLDALAREVSEEVGVRLDASFAPVVVGGWQMCRARDNVINDNFRVFVVRAASEDFQLDMNEVRMCPPAPIIPTGAPRSSGAQPDPCPPPPVQVSSACWFDAASLLRVFRGAGKPDPWATLTHVAPCPSARLMQCAARSLLRDACGSCTPMLLLLRFPVQHVCWLWRPCDSYTMNESGTSQGGWA